MKGNICKVSFFCFCYCINDLNMEFNFKFNFSKTDFKNEIFTLLKLFL